MHVLIIPSWYPTQDRPIAGVFFREQAQALAERGFQVGVIAPQLRSLRRFNVRKISSRVIYENDAGVSTYRWEGFAWFPRVPYANMALWMKAGRRLFKRYVAEHGMPDIIHAHSALNGGVLAAEIAEKHNIPIVLSEHSTAFARNILSWWQKPLVARAFGASQRLIAVSPQLGALLGREYHATEGRWEWVPNIVDGRFFTGSTSKCAAAATPFRLLNVALMTEKKGQMDLITAFADAFGKSEHAELWLGGDGRLRKELEAYAQQLGLGTQVQFLGMLDRKSVRDALAQCDAFVLSSHYETFGVVVVEALASGRPVIATRCGGPECIVRDEDGILVPPGDTAALAGAMRVMRDDIGKYRPEIIRADCRSRFGEDAVVQQLKEVYEEVLEGASKQSVSGTQ